MGGRPVIELGGRRFGGLRVLCRTESVGRGARWLCLCDCGSLRAANSGALRAGRCKWCLRCAARSRRNIRHALWGTPEHYTWQHMKARCTNPDHRCWSDYGGRGIRVCERYLDTPLPLVADIGLRPLGNHASGLALFSLDRIDNDGHYSCGSCEQCVDNGWPLNVRWATRKQQQNNRRRQASLADVEALQRENDRLRLRVRELELGGG